MIRIENDTFDIAWRIKGIDERYQLYYNRRTNRYEVYIGDHLESVIPYSQLDIRALRYVRDTRRENIERLIARLDRENRELENKRMYEVKKKAENRLEEVMRWS